MSRSVVNLLYTILADCCFIIDDIGSIVSDGIGVYGSLTVLSLHSLCGTHSICWPMYSTMATWLGIPSTNTVHMILRL